MSEVKRLLGHHRTPKIQDGFDELRLTKQKRRKTKGRASASSKNSVRRGDAMDSSEQKVLS